MRRSRGASRVEIARKLYKLVAYAQQCAVKEFAHQRSTPPRATSRFSIYATIIPTQRGNARVPKSSHHTFRRQGNTKAPKVAHANGRLMPKKRDHQRDDNHIAITFS